MRVTPPLVLLFAAACGSSSPQPTTPANTTPPPPIEPVIAPPPAVDRSACANHPDEYGPYMLTAEQAAGRYGRNAKMFSDAPTTKDKAIEVCGIPQQQEWLMTTTCADGSRPYNNRREIAESRSGNVGEGGRCGAIIDLYIAKCPEKSYELHIDMYMCGPTDQF